MSIDSDADDLRLRQAAMAWLDELTAIGDGLVTRQQLSTFIFEGERINLIDRGQGIRKPKQLTAALSFFTARPRPGREPRYLDGEGADGLLRYKYQGTDPRSYDNAAMSEARRRGLPLIWFFGIAPSLLQPFYPVWLVGEEPEQHQFVVALDDGQRIIGQSGDLVDEDKRRYASRLTRLRLHQPVFRSRVLHAYSSSCAVCRLRHAELLDAAHILPDGHPRGRPVVPNGLALCKIHHAAFDRNIIGVRPDLVVEVRADVLAEIDGPMLRHGLQEMNGISLQVPRAKEARPDAAAVEERYEAFRGTS